MNEPRLGRPADGTDDTTGHGGLSLLPGWIYRDGCGFRSLCICGSHRHRIRHLWDIPQAVFLDWLLAMDGRTDGTERYTVYRHFCLPHGSALLQRCARLDYAPTFSAALGGHVRVHARLHAALQWRSGTLDVRIQARYLAPYHFCPRAHFVLRSSPEQHGLRNRRTPYPAHHTPSGNLHFRTQHLGSTPHI